MIVNTTNEQKIDQQGLIRELVNLTAMMLKIMEPSEKDYEHLLCVLDQRQQVIDQFKNLTSNEIKEISQDYSLNEELLNLDRLLRQKIEESYQELRDAIMVFQQGKVSMGLYRKKAVFAEGFFLDNKR